jgi:radical SAM superfamily enzyme YgiQ (UPF0313 family)
MLDPCSMKILLLIPPMTQLNTPYPSTAYLKGFLKGQGYLDVSQADPALELILRLFSKSGLERVYQEISCKAQPGQNPILDYFLENANSYINTVDAAIRFLQGQDSTLALRIIKRDFLPEGGRFAPLHEGDGDTRLEAEDSLSLAFGALGVQDRAKYLASLYIDDLADIIREGIDPHFQLSRYAEKLAASTPTFDLIQEKLDRKPNLIEVLLDEIVEDLVQRHQPDVVGLSVPFPGNVYGAFRMARRFKELLPKIKILLGGGYVNTELRSLTEARVFDYFDFVTLDDGERPLLCILELLEGRRRSEQLLRTFVRNGDQVVLVSDRSLHDIPHRDTGTPSYEGLPLSRYLSLFEMLNPMHRIWSDGRWNKLTLAHGCYWKKCNFCDVSLDYIGRYDPASVEILVQRMETLMKETGQSGFHFVDEAAPPALLKALAQRIIEKGLALTWWGNVRFDKAFTPELTDLLARSGCVAVTGGLEVASDRLLKLMQKGVTVEQVARVTQAFTQSGIMVHAYLMYGFPTQTEQETVDALERVRQLFEEGCIQSAFWHRFSATIHSPIGQNPEKFGIELLPEPVVTFARNDLGFVDPVGCDHDRLGEGLRRALYNYMMGSGLDADVRIWFGMKGSKYRTAKAQVPKSLVRQALQTQ